MAKIASDLGKPAGFVAIGREQCAAHFADRSPRIVPGIGPKTAARLAELGYATLGALQNAPVAELQERFGERYGHDLHRRAHLHDESPLVTTRVAKSRSVETTFDDDVADHAELEAILRGQSKRLAEGLQRAKTRGRTIAIKVRLDDWTTVTRARTIDAYINDEATIIAVALELLREYAPPRPVRLLGVRVAGFEGVEEEPVTPHAARGPAGPARALRRRVASSAMSHLTVGGRRLFHQRRGTGEPLLLIQGMSGTHLAWGEPFAADLARDFDAVAYDHRGIGRSDRVDEPFTIAELADDAAGLLDELGWETRTCSGSRWAGWSPRSSRCAIPSGSARWRWAAPTAAGRRRSGGAAGDAAAARRGHAVRRPRAGDPHRLRGQRLGRVRSARTGPTERRSARWPSRCPRRCR